MDMGQSNKAPGYQASDQHHHYLPQYQYQPPPQQQGPQFGFYQPPVQSQPIPMEQQTIIINHNINVGPDPTTIVCPSCRTTVVTRMDYESTTKTHIIAGLLCLFLCWPCVCIPYCTTCCRNGNHYCPSCGSFIGTYSQ